MAQFFGGIQGQAGEATRVGSKRSGVRAYVQDNDARLVVDMDYNEQQERTIACLALTGGWTTYYRTREITLSDTGNILKALDGDDPKMVRIWDRILTEFGKLDAEAAKAVKRVERARKAEERRQEANRQARLEREREFAKTVTDAEVENFLSLVFDGPDQQERADLGMEDDDKVRLRIAQEGYVPSHKPFRDYAGNLIVCNGSGSFNMKRYNLTEGMEIGLPRNEEVAS